MKQSTVLITGMFRSGTTLIARMLHAHPEIAIASDPFSRLFKAFRNRCLESAFSADFDRAAPLADYYQTSQGRLEMQAIQSASLDLDLGSLELATLHAQIAKAAAPFSPRIIEHLQLLSGTNFKELFASSTAVIQAAYGTGREHVIGSKEVWTGEFSRHLLHAFPQVKVINVSRDPRAVCASKLHASASYPLLFLSRQWRKLTAFDWHMQQAEENIKGRYLSIHYESLIENPQEVCTALCDFLEIPFDPVLLDPSQFKDGHGNSWHQNSSHFSGKQIFNTASITKWRQVLSDKQIREIEFLCLPEMLDLGYKVQTEPAEIQSAPLQPLPINRAGLAEWIRPYVRTSQPDIEKTYRWEKQRLGAILSGESTLHDRGKYALFPNYFNHLHQVLNENATL